MYLVERYLIGDKLRKLEFHGVTNLNRKNSNGKEET